MSHPDEGTIQMLLDGELEAAERAKVEGHIATCASCTARLAEAKAFLQEADRLVEVLAVPQRAAAPRSSPRRRVLVRTLAWAASIVIAVGVGYWGRGPNTLTTIPDVLQEGDPPARANVPAVPSQPQNEPTQPAATTPATVSAPADARARQDTDIGGSAGETKAADRPSANELARKEVAAPPPRMQAPAEREARDARSEAVAPRGARLADESATVWRVISMDEAVRVLGGQIRLIDGLTPDRVETGPGTAVAGADPQVALVRVVYAAGAVILDEQRPTATLTEGRQKDAAKAVGGVAAASSATAWQQQGEIRFVVTGSVSPDSLRALGQRVR